VSVVLRDLDYSRSKNFIYT